MTAAEFWKDREVTVTRTGDAPAQGVVQACTEEGLAIEPGGFIGWESILSVDDVQEGRNLISRVVEERKA